MAISAQDKILYVANKLGLSTLKNMQGSTGAVYDYDDSGNGVIFANASQHLNPGRTNINDNRFEVNEALLVETIGFYAASNDGAQNAQVVYGSNEVIVFDLIIGNKTVLKDTPVFMAGSPYTFASVGMGMSPLADPSNPTVVLPRHQVYMEGAGILIPPQVEYQVIVRKYNMITGASTNTTGLGCYLFGTSVLLNFNTSI